MNSCQFVGRLVRDVEVRSFESGKRKADFTIAVSHKFKKADKSDGEQTAFVDCEAWDSSADNLAKFFSKGDVIGLQTRMFTDKWTTKEGENRSRSKFAVEKFWFIPGTSTKNKKEANSDASSAEVSTVDDSQFATMVNSNDPPF